MQQKQWLILVTMMLMMMIMIIKLKDETDATVAGDDNVVLYVYDISRVMIKNQMVDFATKQWLIRTQPSLVWKPWGWRTHPCCWTFESISCIEAELQKRANCANQLVLFFLVGANFWEKHAKNRRKHAKTGENTRKQAKNRRFFGANFFVGKIGRC